MENQPLDENEDKNVLPEMIIEYEDLSFKNQTVKEQAKEIGLRSYLKE